MTSSPHASGAHHPTGGGRLGYLVKAFPRVSETFILNEILELERQGLDLRIYSMIDPPDRLRHRLVDQVRSPITYLPNPLFRSFRTVLSDHVHEFLQRPRAYLSTLLRALTSGDMDLVERFAQAACLARRLEHDGVTHLHAGFVHSPGSVAWLVSLMTGMSFSLASHAKDMYHSPPALLRKKVAAARVIFTCTRYNVPQLEQLCGGAGPIRVRHVYHGTHLGRFQFGAYGRAKPPVILAVARLVEKKGLHTLIRACGELRDRGRSFRCHIVGDGELRDSLVSLIGMLRLERFVALEGALDQEDVLAWYRRATVVALPSVVTSNGDRDGIPNVLIEAAACGVPIVTTAVSGIPEVIEHGKSGLLVPPGDHAALAEALDGMLQSPLLREGLRVNARARVTESFDVQRNAMAIGDELRALAAAPRIQTAGRAAALDAIPQTVK